VAHGGKLPLRTVLQLAGLLHSRQIDLIHAHNGRTLLLACLARSLAGRGEVVATQHFISPTRAGRRGVRGLISRRLHAWVAQRCAHVIAISKAVQQAARARGEATDPASMTVVYNGICPLSVRVDAASAIRNELGLSGKTPLVVCASRLEPEKSIATLVDAWQAVQARVPEAVCVIAGTGQLQAAIEKQIDQRGLRNSIRLIGFRADVQDVMAAGDVFVLPAPAEPFGLVLIEAMSLGKPVIAARAGGPVEIVIDGLTGTLFDPHNASSLSEAIVQMLQSPEMILRMGQAGRARYGEHFAASRMARATADVYQQVMGRAPAPAEDSIRGAHVPAP
jgi:glycosyltransferase involved in cell wall biosynthesis